MAFNLIEKPWIPVRTLSGRKLIITPSEITKDYENDPVAELNAPRPDFNGALIQFLIGLVQTCAGPGDEFEWEEKLENPPVPEELHKAFSTVVHAFDLDGEGPRFMQDLELEKGEEWPVGRLLIDYPGNNAEEKNTDHFVKRGIVSGLCRKCSAAALFTLQTNAPSGGVGHRTSLRGGGPLTTLVLGQQNLLWQTVWLNTLPNRSFLKATSANVRLTDDSCLFPWLGPTRTSELRGGLSTTPLDAHPVQVFWAMPRRIRLDFTRTLPLCCDICHSPEKVLVRRYTTKNYGVNYEGAWRHPLTPYSRNEDGFPLPCHAKPGGISYRHWIGLVQEDLGSKSEVATVVHEFRTTRQNDETAFRLWAFGFDMDKMKARCWYESTMPLIEVRKDLRSDYEHLTADFISAAAAVARNLVTTTKWGFYGKVEKVKRNGEILWKVNKKASKQDINLFQSLSDRFWRNTEPSFYQTLNELKQALEKGSDHKPTRRHWHMILCDQSLKLFDECLLGSPIEDADPKRIALARISLQKFNRSKKITEDLLKLQSAG